MAVEGARCVVLRTEVGSEPAPVIESRVASFAGSSQPPLAHTYNYSCMRGNDMPSTNICLERSAYELLKARKKPDESFSEEIHRLLGGASPGLKGFLDIIPVAEGRPIANAIESIRAGDLELARKRAGQRKRNRGHRA